MSYKVTKLGLSFFLADRLDPLRNYFLRILRMYIVTYVLGEALYFVSWYYDYRLI